MGYDRRRLYGNNPKDGTVIYTDNSQKVAGFAFTLVGIATFAPVEFLPLVHAAIKGWPISQAPSDTTAAVHNFVEALSPLRAELANKTKKELVALLPSTLVSRFRFTAIQSVRIELEVRRSEVSHTFTGQLICDSDGGIRLDAPGLAPIGGRPVEAGFFPKDRQDRSHRRAALEKRCSRLAIALEDLEGVKAAGEFKGEDPKRKREITGLSERSEQEQALVLNLDDAQLSQLIDRVRADLERARKAQQHFGTSDTEGKGGQQAELCNALDRVMNRLFERIAEIVASGGKPVTGLGPIASVGKPDRKPSLGHVERVTQFSTQLHLLSRAIPKQRELSKHDPERLILQDAGGKGWPGSDVAPWNTYAQQITILNRLASEMGHPPFPAKDIDTLLQSLFILKEEPGSLNYEARQLTIRFGEWAQLLYVKNQQPGPNAGQVKAVMERFANAYLAVGRSEVREVRNASSIRAGLQEACGRDLDLLNRAVQSLEKTHGDLLDRPYEKLEEGQQKRISQLVQAVVLEHRHHSLTTEDCVALQEFCEKDQCLLSVRDTGKFSLEALRRGAQPKPHALDATLGLNEREISYLNQQKRTDVDPRTGEIREVYELPDPRRPGHTVNMPIDTHAVLLEKSIKPSSLKGALLDDVDVVPDLCMGLVGHWHSEPQKTLVGIRVLMTKVAALQDLGPDGTTLLKWVRGCQDGTPLEAYVPLADVVAFDKAMEPFGGAVAAGLTGDYDLGSLYDKQTGGGRTDAFDGHGASQERGEAIKEGANSAMGHQRVMHGSQDQFSAYSMQNRVEEKPSPVLDPAIEHAWITADGVYHCKNLMDNIIFSISQGCPPDLPPTERAMASYGADRSKTVAFMALVDLQASLGDRVVQGSARYDKGSKRFFASLDCAKPPPGQAFVVQADVRTKTGRIHRAGFVIGADGKGLEQEIPLDGQPSEGSPIILKNQVQVLPKTTRAEEVVPVVQLIDPP